MRHPCRILPATLLTLLVIMAPIHALDIRGSVFNLGIPEVAWTPQNFAGLYYDLDHNLGDESLTFRLSEVNPAEAILSGDPDATGSCGIVYKTNTRQVPTLSNAKIGTTNGKLRVEDINSTTGIITLDNKNNKITLFKNKTVELMPEIWIKTANQDTISADAPLRYCIYREITKPGTYELRGTVADPSINEFTYTNATFSGFFYDIDKNIGTEQITFRLSNVSTVGATLSGQADANNNRGITYVTQAQPKNFKFRPWGRYYAIGFLGEGYFAAYDNIVTQVMTDAGEIVAFIFDNSKNRNLMTWEQISKVLIDDDTVKLVKKSMKLKEGYELVLKGVNSEGQVYLQLLKNGQMVDESFISPSIYNAGMADKTYYYRKNLGDTNNIVLIAVHFRSVYKDAEQPMGIVDAIWQISDTPTLLNDQRYGKMSIRSVNPTDLSLSMDNKDNPIDLTRKFDVEIMPSIHIRTADNETLRYYIYKTETIT